MFLGTLINFEHSFEVQYLRKAASVFCEAHESLHDIKLLLRKLSSSFLFFQFFLAAKSKIFSSQLFKVFCPAIYVFPMKIWPVILRK